MVLQADVSLPRVILINHITLVSSTARTLIGLRPFVNVHPRNLFAIEFDREQVAVTRNQHMVPLAGRFHGVLGRPDQVIDRSGILKARRR